VNERETRVKALLEADGWTVLRSGAPDFFATKSGRLKAVEVKGPMDTLSETQKSVRDALVSSGIEYDVVYPDGGPTRYGKKGYIESWCRHCRRAPRSSDHPPLDSRIELGEDQDGSLRAELRKALHVEG
jgi:hypothetical protein